MQDAVQEPLAKPLMRSFDPRHLDDVYTNAQDHFNSRRVFESMTSEAV
jgi:hypothetical protein